MKFGRLTVIEKAGYKEGLENGKTRRRTTWSCKCDCGNPEIIECVGTDLVRGSKKSCGCLKYNADYNKKFNVFDLTKEYGVCFTNNTDSFGHSYFLFDLEDYDLIKDYCWHFTKKDYVATSIEGKKSLYLHKFLLGSPKNKVVDHIHGNETKYDNRKENLRIATNSQNEMNSKVSKNNTSGVKGVQWHSRDQVWEAWITVNYKKHYLGRFHEFEEAVKTRKEAEEKYFGEWSYDNSQAIPYNDEKEQQKIA